MFASGGQYAGTVCRTMAAWQWQPTLTSHDPNPPLTIENPVVAAPEVIPYLIMAPLTPPFRRL